MKVRPLAVRRFCGRASPQVDMSIYDEDFITSGRDEQSSSPDVGPSRASMCSAPIAGQHTLMAAE
jgi:hypothetical protein